MGGGSSKTKKQVEIIQTPEEIQAKQEETMKEMRMAKQVDEIRKAQEARERLAQQSAIEERANQEQRLQQLRDDQQRINMEQLQRESMTAIQKKQQDGTLPVKQTQAKLSEYNSPIKQAIIPSRPNQNMGIQINQMNLSQAQQEQSAQQMREAQEKLVQAQRQRQELQQQEQLKQQQMMNRQNQRQAQDDQSENDNEEDESEENSENDEEEDDSEEEDDEEARNRPNNRRQSKKLTRDNGKQRLSNAPQYYDDEQTANFHVKTVNYGNVTNQNSQATNLRESQTDSVVSGIPTSKINMPVVNYNPHGFENQMPRQNVVTGNLISNRELQQDIDMNRNIDINELQMLLDS